MNELIDRKAALDALRRCQTYLYDARDPELKIELSSAEAAINNLSTIQPEKAQLSQEGTTKDAISRRAALDAIGKTSDELYENIKKGATFPQRQWFDGMAQAQSILENLPSAQPERKKGEWSDGYRWQRCSLCKQTGKKSWNYCPNCGADMRGEQG